MTTQTEAERLAEYLETYGPKSNIDRTSLLAAAELRRLVSFNNDLMDEVARLNKAFADERERAQRENAYVALEREECAKVCETHAPTTTPVYVSYAAAIRARGNT